MAGTTRVCEGSISRGAERELAAGGGGLKRAGLPLL